MPASRLAVEIADAVSDAVPSRPTAGPSQETGAPIRLCRWENGTWTPITRTVYGRGRYGRDRYAPELP